MSLGWLWCFQTCGWTKESPSNPTKRNPDNRASDDFDIDQIGFVTSGSDESDGSSGRKDDWPMLLRVSFTTVHPDQISWFSARSVCECVRGWYQTPRGGCGTHRACRTIRERVMEGWPLSVQGWKRREGLGIERETVPRALPSSWIDYEWLGWTWREGWGDQR